MVLVDSRGTVVHGFPAESSDLHGYCNVQLSNAQLLSLGLGSILAFTDSTGKPYYSKGDKTAHVNFSLEVDDAAPGDFIEIHAGPKAESKRKVAAIKALRSVGVAGVPATVGAAMRFVLRAHAP